MLIRRLVAFPESQRILLLHLPATFFFAVLYGLSAMSPFFLRKTLDASPWQTFAATSSISFMYLLAIFWNEVYHRLSPGKYLLLLWCLAIVPLAAVALFSTPWPVLGCLLLSASGSGGIQPIAADILRNCYPPAKRSRIFSVLKVTEQVVVMLTAWGIGVWLDHNHNAYRYFFPASIFIIGLGLLLMHRITLQPLFRERLRHRPTLPLLQSVLQAWKGMAGVLRRDPDFRQFEAGYTTYGLGWMVCFALMPFLTVNVLQLKYEQIVWSTQWAQQFTTLAILVPAGLLMDRIGPIRLSVWTFLSLIIYPIGLIFAWDWQSLAAVTVLYGVSMTGANLVWTMAPVTLAKDASQAPHYLAIHATLVSVRALLGQLPAVAWYYFTGMIYPPLVAAGVLFAVAMVIMIRLDRRLRAPRQELKPSGFPVELVADK